MKTRMYLWNQGGKDPVLNKVCNKKIEIPMLYVQLAPYCAHGGGILTSGQLETTQSLCVLLSEYSMRGIHPCSHQLSGSEGKFLVFYSVISSFRVHLIREVTGGSVCCSSQFWSVQSVVARVHALVERHDGGNGWQKTTFISRLTGAESTEGTGTHITFKGASQ